MSDAPGPGPATRRRRRTRPRLASAPARLATRQRLAALGAVGVGLVLTLTALPAAAVVGDRAPSVAHGVGPAVNATDPAPVVAGTLPVEVTLDSMSPAILQPGQDLTVTVTLRNTGAVALAAPRVLLDLDRDPFVSRSSLTAWRTADASAELGTALVHVDLPAPLAPGASATATAVLPASAHGLRARAAWGPRGVALEVVDVADPTRARQGLLRTFLLWFPEQEVTATRVSVLAPVVGPAVDPYSEAPLEELAAQTRPGGRLADVLAATREHPEVSWALDPELLESVTTADDDATATPSSTAVATWVDGVLEAATDREIALLPYADADVSALAHAQAGSILATAVDRSTRVAAAAGLPGASTLSLALPADGRADLATAAFVNRGSARAVVVGPGDLPSPAVLTYTPTGRATVAAAAGDVTVLVPDERLSTALTTGLVDGAGTDDGAGTADAAADAEPPAADSAAAGSAGTDDLRPAESSAPAVDPAVATPAYAAQDLLAELAVITRERPSTARHLLLTVPRDWEPDVAVVDAQLDALEQAPWVHVEPVAALVGSDDPGVDRGTLPARETDDAEIAPSQLAGLGGAIDGRTALVGMVEDPATLLGDVERELLAPLSVAWRADPVGRGAVVARAAATTATLQDAVSVQPSSDFNLVSRTGEVPVRVTNALDLPVTVAVSLRPNDRRLVADEPVLVTIPAASETIVRVPVHAVQSADVAITVEVRTQAGDLVDDDATFTVRVRAEWESIGTAIIGSLLAVGVLVGVFRTIRRGRTARRAAPVAAGPDALSPEEQAEDDVDTDAPAEGVGRGPGS
ncbi:DUF6049 family protein [Actinotalea subterranea]|uniref:DUF6049 family protein n=1 Tax=Actinotalea subterranea TaxID=2607497 RepID=UPI0011EFC150|nr:DUF6049 family protein [Actinotalea subterranea]